MRHGITNKDFRNPGNNHLTPKGTKCYYSDKLKSWIGLDTTWNDPNRYQFISESYVNEIGGK